jgi:hypothetical protein
VKEERGSPSCEVRASERFEVLCDVGEKREIDSQILPRGT